MKKIIYIIAFLVSYLGFSQNYKFGKVSKEELQEQFNPLDSSANATYLYKYRKTHFEYQQGEGFYLITEIRERIKIYNQEGFDYATRTINTHKSGGVKEQIIGLKAYTYNLEQGKVEDTKLKNDGVFETELYKYTNQTKFTMPNLKQGSVIEYEFKIKSPFIYNVDEFVFQEDIPTKKLEAIFEAPEYYTFKTNTKGFLNIRPKVENSDDRITFNSKSRRFGGTKFNSSDLEFKKSVSTYDLSDIPALKDEPYVNSIYNYRSAVKYELSYSKLPNSFTKYYTTTWDDVVKTIYKSESLGLELKKTNYFEEDIDALISGVNDQAKRAGLIFNFVKSNVKWNGYYSKYTNEGVKKAYKNHVGNVAEINLMLTAMLRYAGLNANPVLVSTRNNGVPIFPTREGYNYIISVIELQGNVVLLDATSKFGSPNILPYRTLNWQGRVVRDDGSSTLVNLYPTTKAKSTYYMNVELNDNGDVTGKVRNALTNHDAMRFRESYVQRNKEEYLEALEARYKGIEITDFDVKNELDLSKPVMSSFEFLAEDQLEVIGGKMFVKPLFFLTEDENPFKSENREFPIDFGYPSGRKYNISIAIPEGYKIEAIPEPAVLMLPDGLGSFKYNVTAKDTSIQLVISYDNNSAIVSQQYYDALKEYFKQFIEKENERIVLTKI
ncbi:transglutaminase domain-containing protein [Ichthyenterobacterium magnum]|uniref:Uncharacterized protein DUF3857 n=1 Tax=Ichthyenterobacterium magnum TaxID=1230530 RepID=A0A420DFU1_9FLAO|nr:transglutaminase domain-containing protein [Ichthyenterobacterium magnum]RKE91955.1 uncharacterized protein DUF3857 [Ichthyenterobacterium magnum]